MKHLVLSLLLTVSLACKHVYADVPTVKHHQEYPTYFAHVNNINLAYQDFGNPNDDTILLVMGLGGQLIHWDDDFVLAFVDKGYRVIRYDNRDAGWSSKLFEQDVPGIFTMIRYKFGMELNAPYKLDDMAADGIALLDHLDIEKAHVVGLSMGGMIAQIMAAQYPEHIATLTSIMSTSGARNLPKATIQPSLKSNKKLNREDTIQANATFAEKIDGTTAELSHDEWLARMARSFDRAHYSDGLGRQLWAIADSGDRVELLKTVTQPTLVIHGKADPLIPYQGGEHTAELVPDAKLVLVEGMGHFIDKSSKSIIVDEMLHLLNQHTMTNVKTSTFVSGR